MVLLLGLLKNVHKTPVCQRHFEDLTFPTILDVPPGIFPLISGTTRPQSLQGHQGGRNSGGLPNLQPHSDLAHRGPVKDAAMDRKAGRKKSRVDGKNRHRRGTCSSAADWLIDRSSAADWLIDRSSGQLVSDRFSQTPGPRTSHNCVSGRSVTLGLEDKMLLKVG